MKKLVMITLMFLFAGTMLFGRFAMAGPECSHCHEPLKDMVDCSALCCQPITVTFADILSEPVMGGSHDFVVKPFLYSRKIAREVFHPPRHTFFV